MPPPVPPLHPFPVQSEALVSTLPPGYQNMFHALSDGIRVAASCTAAGKQRRPPGDVTCLCVAGGRGGRPTHISTNKHGL